MDHPNASCHRVCLTSMKRVVQDNINKGALALSHCWCPWGCWRICYRDHLPNILCPLEHPCCGQLEQQPIHFPLLRRIPHMWGPGLLARWIDMLETQCMGTQEKWQKEGVPFCMFFNLLGMARNYPKKRLHKSPESSLFSGPTQVETYSNLPIVYLKINKYIYI